jgi:hypothetical protein
MFDQVLADAGMTVVLSGVRMPRMNSIMERWIQACRRELLDRTWPPSPQPPPVTPPRADRRGRLHNPRLALKLPSDPYVRAWLLATEGDAEGLNELLGRPNFFCPWPVMTSSSVRRA